MGKNKDCWRAAGTKKLRYRNQGPDRQNVVLAGGDEGHGTISVANKGASMASAVLPLTAPVQAQWHNTRNNVCWAASYTGAGIVSNTSTKFVARN